MADNTIQSFLVELGWKVDSGSFQKFSNALVSTSKSIIGISLALEGAQVALTAFTTKIASELENLFYSSTRAGTTIANLQSLQYALGQTGEGADSAAAMLENFRMAMRVNPAIEGFLNGLGVMTRGVDGHLRDTNSIFEDFIRQMRSEPFPIAKQMAEMLGISPQQLLMLEQGQDARLKAEADFLAKERQLGLNPDQFGKTSVDFMNSLRDLGSTVEIIFQKIGVELLPDMTSGVKSLNDLLLQNSGSVKTLADAIRDIVHAVREEIEADVKDFKSVVEWVDHVIDRFTALKKLLGHDAAIVPFGNASKHDPNNPNDLGKMPEGLRDRLDQLKNIPGDVQEGMKKFFEWMKTQPGVEPSPTAYEGGQLKAILASFNVGTESFRDGALAAGRNLFSGIETSFNLPPGLLSAVRRQESGSNNNAVSSTGAQGPFQFMPGTWSRYGQGSPFDLTASANAAARYFSNLLQMFGGNLAKALAGYNWGETNVAKDVAKWGDAWLQHAPNETQNYVGSILGRNAFLGQSGGQRGAPPSVHIEQNNSIHAPDPSTAGKEVAVRTRSVWSDVVRNMRQAGVYA